MFIPWIAYTRLMRLDKPTGLILLACPALLAVSQQLNPYSFMTTIIITGIVLSRSLGCVINDIADKDIDCLVPRTAQRPLASGELSVYQAVLLAVFLAILCLILFAWIPQSAYLSLIFAAATILVYPFTKRFFALPQLFLGLSFSSSIPVVYAIFEQPLTIKAWLSFFATICWVISFDTLYALNDLEYDRKLPIKSLPKTLGEGTSCVLAQLLLGIAHISIISQLPFKPTLVPLEILATSLMGLIFIQASPCRAYNLRLFHLNAFLGILWCILSFMAR